MLGYKKTLPNEHGKLPHIGGLLFMKLLFDHVVQRLNSLALSNKLNVSEQKLKELFSRNAQKFLVDNIYSTLPKTINPAEIPNIAPPFSNMWFEWQIPVDEIPDERLQGALGRQGVYLSSERSPEGWESIFLCFSYFEKQRNVVLYIQPLVFKCVIPLNGRTPKDGLKIAHMVTKGSPLLPNPLSEDYVQKLAHAMMIDYVLMTLFCIGLLHCKNIVTEQRGGVNPNIKNRRHRSKGTRHHVLKVVPAREIKRTRYDQPGTGSPQSLHFRRGHFKEYTADKPLFGKHTGVFWWEAHAAGNAEIGKVTKDYQIFPKATGAGV